MKLIIGNKNYSTWSLRPWVLLKHFDIEFDEILLRLFNEEYEKEITKYSPTGKVPVLIDKEKTIWDSLAIAEYINENYLQNKGWGETPHWGRSITAEMHSGFSGIRSEMSMNCRAVRRIQPSAQTVNDVARINDIWTQCRTTHQSKGDWLFGEFTIADAFYAPIALRMITYAQASGLAATLTEESQHYIKTVIAHPAITTWINAAKIEQEVIEVCEQGENL